MCIRVHAQPRVSLYFAAPLRSPGLRRWNRMLALMLEPRFSVYLPQRDGGFLGDMLSEGGSRADACSLLFERDIVALREACLVLAAFPSPNVDEGVAFEMGFAEALGIPRWAFFRRAAFVERALENAMMLPGWQGIIRGYDELYSWLNRTPDRSGCPRGSCSLNGSATALAVLEAEMQRGSVDQGGRTYPYDAMQTRSKLDVHTPPCNLNLFDGWPARLDLTSSGSQTREAVPSRRRSRPPRAGAPRGRE